MGAQDVDEPTQEPGVRGAHRQQADQPGTVRGWVVVNTHSHREDVARSNLERQGFETYFPVIRKRISVARRGKEVLRPLFPGYMFVTLPAEAQWRPLLSTYGVRRVLCCGDAPSLIDGGFVGALRSREVAGVIERPASPYEIGQSIAITEGPFEGLVARIVGLEDRDRVAVLLHILGKQTRAVFDTRAIAPSVASRHS